MLHLLIQIQNLRHLAKLLTKFYFLLLPEPIKRTVSIPLCSYKAGESKGCELARVYPVLVQVPDI